MFTDVLAVTALSFAAGAGLLAFQRWRAPGGTTWQKYAVYLAFVVAMLALAQVGAALLAAALLGIITAALVEFGRAAGLRRGGQAALLLTGLAAGATALWSAAALYRFALLGSLGLMATGAVTRSPSDDMPRAVWAVTGFLAIAVSGAHLLLLPAAGNRFPAFAFLFLVICGGDAFAELIGRTWPVGRGFVPASPGKTVSGLVGGLAAAVVLGMAVSGVTGFRSPPVAAAIALAAGGAGALGDLVASAWKRAFGLKDFAAALPGHGGVLDRVDGLLFAAPPFYWLLRV